MSKKLAGLALALGLLGAAVSLAPSVGAAGRPAMADGQGSKIAFTRLCEIAGCSESVEDQQAEIWVMNGDGSDPRQLTHNTTFDLGAVWSPNGKTVAFYGAQFDPITEKQVGSPHVYLINADGSDQRLLTDHPGRWPSFSPDGKKIAFDSGGQSSNIFVANTDGTDLHPLTTDKSARNIRPDWSPDGQQIAYSSQRDNGHDEIYVMNADGSDQTRLTNTDISVSNIAPAWSPNGKKLLFQSNRDLNPDGTPNEEIYVMNADGSDQTNLTNYAGRDEDPAWSPSGLQITFHRDIEPIDQQILQIYTMNADGSNPTQLTGLAGDPSENGHPGWGRGPALLP
jgi:Tol biopolymer transport system component